MRFVAIVLAISEGLVSADGIARPIMLVARLRDVEVDEVTGGGGPS